MNNTVYGKEVDAWTSTRQGRGLQAGRTPWRRSSRSSSYVTTFDNIENIAGAGSVHTLNPGHLAVVRAPGHGGQGREPGHDAGPGDRPEARPADRAALAGTGCRDHRADRGGQWRLLLGHHVLCRAQQAAADGIQPAQGVHPADGRRRHRGRTRRAAAQERQHPRHDQRTHQGAAQGPGPGRPAGAVRLPRHGARTRAPREHGERARPERRRRARCAGGRAGGSSTSSSR